MEAAAIESEAVQRSFVHWLIQNSSGPLVLALLALGAILIVWGLMNVFFAKNPVLLTLQALLSFVPALLSAVGALYAFAGFTHLASSQSPESPDVFAAVISTGIACGIWGPVMTFVAGTLGILALAKIAFASGRVRDEAITEKSVA